MVDKIETRGLIGKIKSLILGRRPQAPAVVPNAKSQEVPVIVVKQEQPPYGLSPFEQIQALLEKESGITDPNKRRREVRLEKKVWSFERARPGQKDPAYITITQTGGVREYGKWDDTLDVYIYVATDDDLIKYNSEHNLRGMPVGKPLSGDLVISQQEPKLTLKPVKSSYDYVPDDIWEILGLSKPKYEGDTSIWSGITKTRAGKRTSPCTTNNAQELEKVVRFITVDETDRSAPKIIGKR